MIDINDNIKIIILLIPMAILVYYSFSSNDREDIFLGKNVSLVLLDLLLLLHGSVVHKFV